MKANLPPLITTFCLTTLLLTQLSPARGKISLMLWLFVKGANVQRWNEQSSLGL